MSKKWYNYFVETAPPGAESADPAVPGAPARVTDLVGDAEAETTFAEPVTAPTDLAVVYQSAQIPTPSHGYTVIKVAEMLRT